MRTFTIRTHILLLVLVVSAPLVMSVAYGIYYDMTKSVRHTKEDLRMVAESMSINTHNEITKARQILEILAARKSTETLDSKHCDNEILHDVVYLHASYANIGYTDITGHVVCTAVARPGGKPVELGNTSWYQKFLQRKNFTLGEPYLGPITGKMVTVLSVPIWNKHHEMIGGVHLPLDLSIYDPHIPGELLPPGSHYGFFNDDGILIWRNVDPDNIIGTKSGTEAAKKIMRVRDGEAEGTASDGVKRFISVVAMPEDGLVAWVGVPVSEVYAASKARAILIAIFAVFAVILLYFIALVTVRRITRPIVELERVAREVQSGNLESRASEQGPEDIASVAHEFNAMITAQQHSLAELRIAATAFESQESLMITNADGVIQRVNHAFVQTTGYLAEECVGQTPRMFKSGHHDAEFYRNMWQTLLRTGGWQGEIWDRRKNGEIYPKWLSITAVKGADGKVTHYVGSHIDITERKAAELEIQNLAFNDPLTHLPNRRFLVDRLQHVLASSARSGRNGALLFIDLDHFKNLNDSLGHGIGDQLLQQVAERLEACVREGDIVARLGGDEFVVILENLSEKTIEAAAQTEAVGEKILATLKQPYQLASYEYNSTTSIGAALFNDNNHTVDELMKQADIAMYQAKKSGRNSLHFFDPQMQAAITNRATLGNELHRAIEGRQFRLYYQIQVDSSFRPIGAEALLRWIHPERGLMYPDEFISLAEETSLILIIGHWVLETACAQIKAWQQDPLTRSLVLAVNVSAKQFHQGDFVTQVREVVQRHAIDPARLKLELTESILLENIEGIIVTMSALNDIGVQFSLDDFGTGYSSLQYLKQLPLDQLKIDQSFVRDIAADSSDKAIVSTIIAMAQSLNLDVIAEGVETEEQRQFLMNRNCIHYQGYLFGSPVPIEQFEELLKRT
jgi:diguanylate cyclase (GGDEF)-like protein/PAS domain S-box-containing protein